MTLAEFYALDPLAAWAALSPDRQAAIIGPLLTCAFAEVCQDDDGTDCSDADKETAAGIVQSSYQAMWDAVKASFDILADDYTALHGFDYSMIDAAGKILVKGVRGKRQMRSGPGCYDQHVRIGGQKVRVVGFKNIAQPGQPEVWQAWTQAQVDAERVRRHPDQLVTVIGSAPTFRSVLEVPISHQVTSDAEYRDQAA